MKITTLSFCALLGIGSNAWSADAPVVDPASVTPPAVTDIELPAAFTTAQPAPLPEKSNEPVEVSQPAEPFLPYEVETGTSYSRLNNGYADWSGLFVNAEMKLGARNNIYGSVRKENRYSKSDTEFMGGIYDPINDYLTAIAEISISTTHSVLPARSFFLQLQYEGPQGWIAGSGLRHTEYNAALVNLLTPTVERSWGNYRVSLTRFQSFFSGHGSGSSHQMQFAKYYGNHNWVGATVSSGDEFETIPNAQVMSSRVRSLVVSGRHWLRSELALNYNVGNYRQGNFFVRNGIELGLRYQF